MTTRATSDLSVESDWIPLVEYALKKGVSLSTLRRHIKAGKIAYKVDEGRYLLFDDSMKQADDPSVARLHHDLQAAHEEIAELKTLIALYEEKIPHQRPGN